MDFTLWSHSLFFFVFFEVSDVKIFWLISYFSCSSGGLLFGFLPVGKNFSRYSTVE